MARTLSQAALSKSVRILEMGRRLAPALPRPQQIALAAPFLAQRTWESVWPRTWRESETKKLSHPQCRAYLAHDNL